MWLNLICPWLPAVLVRGLPGKVTCHVVLIADPDVIAETAIVSGPGLRPGKQLVAGIELPCGPVIPGLRKIRRGGVLQRLQPVHQMARDLVEVLLQDVARTLPAQALVREGLLAAGVDVVPDAPGFLGAERLGEAQ